MASWRLKKQKIMAHLRINQKQAILAVTVCVFFVLTFSGFFSTIGSTLNGSNAKAVLENRLNEVELELTDKTKKLNSLEQLIESKDTQLAEDQLKLSSLHEKDEELAKLKKIIESTERTSSSTGSVKVNANYYKQSFHKEKPEYQRVTYISVSKDSTQNSNIVLTSIAHSESYGPNRQFEDFLKVIDSIDFDKTKSSLGLIVGSKEEYENIQRIIEKRTSTEEGLKFFSKIIIIQSEFIESLYTLDRSTRHQLDVQKERRRAISRARNFLISNALGDETYSLCLDSDIIDVPSNTMELFINSGKDIIVPRIRKGGAVNYDFNSWQGERIEPDAEQDLKLDANDPEFVFVPRPVIGKTKHMHDFGNEDAGVDFIVPLDSVGGAVLFLKSEIFKQGVVFPPYYIVGTKWGRFEGYDGIETEGICYQARTIGYKCWGMPNLVASHVFEVVDKDE